MGAVGPIKTINFPVAEAINPGDEVIINQGGKTKRAAVPLLADGIGPATDEDPVVVSADDEDTRLFFDLDDVDPGDDVTLTVQNQDGTIALLESPNEFTVGPQTVRTGGASNKGRVTKAAASQAAPLDEWQASSGTPIARVGADGDIRTNDNFFISNNGRGLTFVDDPQNDGFNNSHILYGTSDGRIAMTATGFLMEQNGGFPTLTLRPFSSGFADDAACEAVRIRPEVPATPDAGFGAAVAYGLQDSTGADRDAGGEAVVWDDPVHLTRTSRWEARTVTDAGAIEVVGVFDGGGSASPPADNTGLMLWDVNSGALQRVTVGSADSGGSGYRLLRIPN